MKYLKEVFQVQFQDIEFDGLRFSAIDEESSFKSIKERNAYLDNLLKEGSEFSSMRYKNIFKEFQKAEIHVKLSLSFIFRIISFSLLTLALIASIASASVVGFVMMGMALGTLILHTYNKRRAKDLYIGFLSGPEIIDYMFEKIQNSCETK